MNHINHKYRLSPEYSKLLEIAHHIHTPGSLNELCEYLLDMKQAQKERPTEQRQLAFDFATSANSAALVEIAEEYVHELSDKAGKLPRALLAGLAKQQQERINTHENERKVISLFSLPYFEYLKLVHTAAPDSDYSFPGCGDMEFSISSSMEERLADKLIAEVIPEYKKEHPEDAMAALRFSFWVIMRRLTGEELYAPLSFLEVEGEDARLLYPNRLNEESPLEDFFICAEAISEVSEFLPFIAVQNLIGDLLFTLRTRLDKELLSLVDDGEVVLSTWALTQAEVLREARIAEEFAENPDDLNDIIYEVSCIVDSLSENETPDIDCLSTSSHKLLDGKLLDNLIFTMVDKVDTDWELSKFVKEILPLYVAIVSRNTRGRCDYWEDPLYILWANVMRRKLAM